MALREVCDYFSELHFSFKGMLECIIFKFSGWVLEDIRDPYMIRKDKSMDDISREQNLRRTYFREFPYIRMWIS